MTEAQAAYLKRLSDQAGEPFDPNLTKAEASKRIDALRSGESAKSSTRRDVAPARRESGAVRRITGEVTRITRASDEASGFDDRMTDAQAAYLRELLQDEAEEDFDPHLSRDAAHRRIAELLLRHLEHSAGGTHR